MIDYKDVYTRNKDDLMLLLDAHNMKYIWNAHKSCLYIPDTYIDIGVYPFSDFIIYYDENSQPTHIIESAFRNKYNLIKWIKLTYKHWHMTSLLRYNCGFKITSNIKWGRADYTSYKEEWLRCVKKQ